MATPAPSPTGSRLFGSLFELRRDSLGVLLNGMRECGDVVRFVAGPPGLRLTLHGVFSAEGAQRVLATDAANFRKDSKTYVEVRAAFGDGLFTSQDDVYRRQRRLIQPLFTRRRVDQYADAMREEVSTVLRRWRDRTDRVVDLRDESTRLTLRVVARILFGADVEEAVGTMRHSFPIISGSVARRTVSPITLPRSWDRGYVTAHRRVHELCDRIIAERAADGRDEGDDLLGLLARVRDETGDRLAASEVRDQVLIFLLAGHETTATALTFALHLMAHHRDVQARARDEVDRVLGGRPPGAADLDRLTYTTWVLKEAMRLYPPVPSIVRRAVDEAEIGGYRIPAGSDVFVSPWVTHRHPAYWPDPERFDPERFRPEEEAGRPRYAWFPFGRGPRACIGEHFSMLEAVQALAMVLQEFELEGVDSDVSLDQGMTLHATSPVRCRLSPR
ncbi:cytochrome P450 [Saccharothrix yanglingensis]|uniref:Cytochrome P450 n=1 Tax=Saccharothrix yanglingensis TaxID=659496 RepID=A0ABU0WUR7_9PSEU|nr:cytochrome P450 [Saccharothrix yanglingensis]MDQ2583582.1 cytochrome P450 [Saccharothrix yanglingensis]